MMLKVRLHETASALSLALARVLVFVVWTVYVLVDPIERLALLPIELFHPHGVFVLVPDAFWVGLVTPAGLVGLKALLIVMFAWAAIGFKGARLVTGLAAIVLLTYLQVKKGFGGHWDHREMSLLYVTALLTITPAWDALAVHRSRGAADRRRGAYRAALLVACFIIIVQYVFIGAARLFIGGPGVFLGGTLQRWVENRNLRPNPFGFELGTLFLDPFWAPLLDLAFFGSTVLEIAVIGMLFLSARLWWVKLVFILAFLSFHGAIFLLMNVAFPEDAALLLLFLDLAAPFRAMRRGHEQHGTLRFDPGNATAIDVAAKAREIDGLDVEPDAAAEGGLAFVADDGTSAEGERARTEVLYRTPGRLVHAWLRDRRRVHGDLAADRAPLAAWFVGTRAEAHVDASDESSSSESSSSESSSS